MRNIFDAGLKKTRYGFRTVDWAWQKFNNGKEKFLVFLSKRYIPQIITPNLLCWLRIIFSLAIVVMLFYYGSCRNWILGLLIFCVLSDLFDGPLARSRHIESEKGAFLDRLGDKLLVCPLVIYLFWAQHKYLVSILVGSEVSSMCLAVLARKKRVSAKSNWYGKWKMVFQSAGILVQLIFPHASVTAVNIMWIGLGLGLASLMGHFQSYLFETAQK